MICGVGPRHRLVLAGCALLGAACVLASCGNSPAPHAAPTTTTSTTTTTTTPPPTTTVPAGVGVPNVVGMKFDLARFYLKTAGFATVPLNAPCNKGTLPSQSVVASLSIPGKPPNVTVGAQPLVPGTPLPKGARVGITWSGCYPAGTTVPLVTGHTFAGRGAPSAPGRPELGLLLGRPDHDDDHRPSHHDHYDTTRDDQHRRRHEFHDHDHSGTCHDNNETAARRRPQPGCQGRRRRTGQRRRHPGHASLSAVTQPGAGSEGREATPEPAPEQLAFGTARGRWVLAATVLGSGIAFLDSTVVGIALPSISRTFGGGVGTLQWVITGYSLTLAAFLLLGGSLGDRFGRQARLLHRHRLVRRRLRRLRPGPHARAFSSVPASSRASGAPC